MGLEPRPQAVRYHAACHELNVLVRKITQVSATLSFIAQRSARKVVYSDLAFLLGHALMYSPMQRIQLVAALLFALSGVAGLPAAAQVANTPATPTQAQPVAVPPPAQQTDNRYIIGPGDSLQVFVWRSPELTTVVPVRPDGKISTPLVEDMIAVGKTPSALARDIEKVLAEYIRSPQVNVIVTQPVSTFSQVKVIGQVTNPQSMAYREGMRVLDVVLAAGGLGQFAAGNRAKVVRMQDGKEVSIKVKLDDLVNKGAMKHNLELRPGDVLVVPESIF
jgi:polysaccharide biosynthesis/export protein